MKARRKVSAYREKVCGEKAKTFKVTLTEGQIAILKASLKYYFLDDSFGYALWETMPGATIGRVDTVYMRMTMDIMDTLEKLSKVKPDFGWWGDIERLFDLCEKETKKARKEGEEAEAMLIEYYEKEERAARKKVRGAESPEPIPVGVYQAKLTDIEKISIEKREEDLYFDYIRLKFEIIEGDYKGVERNQICSSELTKGKNRETNSELFNTLTGLLGKEPERDVGIESDSLIGTKCQIFMEDEKEKDGVVWQNITKVLPAKAPKIESGVI